MRHSLLCSLSALLLAIGQPALAQDAEEPAAEDAAAESVAATDDEASSVDADAADVLDDLDDADLDLQTYEQDDDDFIPTEEVPADQAIPFPSDI